MIATHLYSQLITFKSLACPVVIGIIGSRLLSLPPSMAELKTVAFHTLGCKLNFSETSSLSRLLENEGFEKKEFEEHGRCVCDQYLFCYRKCG